ncbi:MAG: HPr family phosphocarrier protein [Lachnospiraceae bacterium]
MKTFQYTIREELGMHARPAGLILQLAKEFESSIVVSNKGNSGDLKRLMSVIGLDIRYQDTVTVTVEGPDEDVAAEEMLAFFEENL